MNRNDNWVEAICFILGTVLGVGILIGIGVVKLLEVLL